MRLIVQKYGGTSVATSERIRNVARRLVETQREGCRVMAVISAMAGVTDDLIKLAHEISEHPAERELDILLATGEHAATALVAMAVNALGGRATSVTGAQAGILTDRKHTKARIANISPKQIHELLLDDYIVVVAGFQGQTPEGETTTLGRGGSDLTAIALAGALNADVCQIFTDVDGVFTCDPRAVLAAKKLDEIAYDELLEMAGAGSKVVQSRAVEFAKKFGVQFEVRSSFNRNVGTIAKAETASMEDVVIRGISLDRHQAKLTIAGVPDEPEIARKILMPVVGEIGAKRLNTASGMAKLSVVGIGMRSHSGVAARLFECLGRSGINIQLVSTSEIKITVIIDEKDAERAAQLIHAEFGLAGLVPAARGTAALA